MTGSLHFFKFCLFAALFSQETIAEETKAAPSYKQPGHVFQTTSKKKLIGLPLRTDNSVSHKTIPAHWEKFFKENILEKIPGRTTGEILAVYTQYEKDHTKPYTMILGCEVESLDQVPEGLVGLEIPASRYAVFTTNGPHPQGVINVWQSVWKGGLKRTFTSDFEVYTCQFDPVKNPQLQVFIAVE